MSIQNAVRGYFIFGTNIFEPIQGEMGFGVFERPAPYAWYASTLYALLLTVPLHTIFQTVLIAPQVQSLVQSMFHP